MASAQFITGKRAPRNGYVSGGLPPAKVAWREKGRCSGPPVRAGFSKKNGSPGGVNPFPLRGKWL